MLEEEEGFRFRGKGDGGEWVAESEARFVCRGGFVDVDLVVPTRCCDDVARVIVEICGKLHDVLGVVSSLVEYFAGKVAGDH